MVKIVKKTIHKLIIFLIIIAMSAGGLFFLLKPQPVYAAFEYRRPTDFTDDGNYTVNEAQAYNVNDPPPDDTNYADTTTDLYGGATSVTYHTWETKNYTYTALLLKVHRQTAGAGNDKFGIQYTINGADWNDIDALGNGNIDPAATATIDLNAVHSLLDPANLQVRIITDVVGPADSDHIYIYDVWTEGTYSTNSTPTLSSVEDFPDPLEPGTLITFSADWNDADVEGVNLFVCDSSGGDENGCPSGTWCSTSGHGTGDPMTCAYEATSSDIGTNNYWAYVCDDEPSCSSEISGSFIVQGASVEAMRLKGRMNIKGGIWFKW